MRHALRLAVFLFAVPSFASITGSVMNGDGQAVAGAKITVYSLETPEARRERIVSATPQRTPLGTATTDANGSFRVDVPKEQSFVDLRVDAAGYAPEISWSMADDDEGAIVLTRAAAKTGTITANGKPVAHASVFWFGPGAVESFAVTDANGKYSVPDPSKWAARVVVLHPDYAPFSEIVAVMTGAARASADRSLTTGVKLTGRVVGEDGTTPAAGAELVLDHLPVGKTAADGTFAIAHARKDWQELEAHLGPRVARRAHADGALTLKLAKGSTLAGTIVDARTQQPVAGASVAILPGGLFMGGGAADVAHGAITDAKGAFSFPNIASGNYTIVVDRPGYNVPRAEVAVVAGRTVQKPLYAAQLGTISGVVVDEDKRPVAAAKIGARSAARDGGMNFMNFIGRPPSRGIYSGPDGRFVDRGVATEHDVIVDAVKKGYPPAHTAALRVNPGEKKGGVSLTIPRGLAFSGRVLDKNNKPVAGATVELNESTPDPGGNMRRMIMGAMGRQNDDAVRSAPDGTFLVRVKEGRYDVNVKAEGYAGKILRAQSVAAGMKPVDVVLEPGVEITGRVTRGGVGVDGVMVATVSMSEGMSSTQTAPDGTFRLGDLTPGPAMLVVNKQEAFIQEMRNVIAPARDVNIELPPGGRIAGHVVDKASHQPVTSFQAGVSTSRGGGMVVQTPPMLKAFTSDDGAFALDNVRPGPTQVVVNAPGYTQGRVANIEVEEGKTAPDVMVELETGVKLVGKVTGPDGQPVAGVTVAPDQSTRGGRVLRFDAMASSAVTDPNGEYTIEALEPGEKNFNFSRSGYVTETRTVNLAGKEVRSDVQLSSGLRAGGVVVTEGGAPVADALVRASSASDSMFGREARSDSNGNFQFEGLAPGHYTINAAKSGYASGVVRDVDVASGAPIRVTMKSGGTIAGHVSGLTAEEMQQTTVSASVPGAGGSSSPVDAGGNYRIDGAPTGSVRVVARVGGGFGPGTKSSEPKTVVLDPGGSATADIEFKSNTIVRGHITKTGRPMPNAMVMFIPKGARTQTSASATSDASGYYELNGLADGPYNVQVIDFDRLNPTTASYEVKGSGTFDIDIKTSTVRGRVIDATNDQPIADARVEIRPAGSDSMLGTRAVMSDAGGNFILDGVNRGAYSIAADKEGWGHAMKNVSVEEAPADVELKLSPSAGIVLRVVDGRDGNLLTAFAHVTDMQGNALDSGRFGMPSAPEPVKIDVAPGTYRVSLYANGYAAKTLTVTAPANMAVPMTPGGTLLIKSKSSATDLRVRLIGSDGQIYGRLGFNEGAAPLLASPAVTTMQNVAAGTYRVEVIDKTDRVVDSTSVTVTEGQAATVEI